MIFNYLEDSSDSAEETPDYVVSIVIFVFIIWS
jgi:hypothetical protein